MADMKELTAVRKRLLDERKVHEDAIDRIDKALEGMKNVADILGVVSISTPQKHQELAGFDCTDLGPTDIILSACTSDSDEWWSVDDIIKFAEANGKVFDYPNPPNNINVSAHRLTKRGVLRSTRRQGKRCYQLVEGK